VVNVSKNMAVVSVACIARQRAISPSELSFGHRRCFHPWRPLLGRRSRSHLHPFRLQGKLQPATTRVHTGPLAKWIDSERYAIEAKAASPASKDQMRLMMQALLMDRFQLAVHFETQETAVMAVKR
jgi:hypothetical protein